MSEAPKRIGICPIHKTWHREPHETDWNYIRADLAEAKLAKAVQALDRIAGTAPYADDPYDIARAALAELKGDKT